MARNSATSPKKARSAEREQLLARAREQKLRESWDVCVLGGGAAGIVAAITAAELGASVLVLERELFCGRTILATGNGRCNFANADLSPSNYNHPNFVGAVMGDDALTDILEFFSECGLAWTEEEGRLYPRSLVAASVRDVLIARAQNADVCFACAREVTGIEPASGGGFRVFFSELWDEGAEASVSATCVISALGGPIPQIEGCELEFTGMYPVLCALRCQTQRLGSLDGRRARCTARVFRDEDLIHEEAGEILFRRMGLSGILAYNLSRYAEMGDTISLDLCPEKSAEQIAELIRERSFRALSGIIDPAIAVAIREVCEMQDGDGSEASFEERAAALVKAFTARVIGTMDEEHAQVIRGGLAVGQFDTDTLEAKDAPGFFACGEGLDVDGACGGYNLAWAWKSGSVAGDAAACTALGLEPVSSTE